MNNRNKLQPLQGLRALATIGIFLFHSGLLLQGTFPVTLFFMLSGFLIYYTKNRIVDDMKYKNWLLDYVLRKFKQFYPLHVFTFIIACIVGDVIHKLSWGIVVKGMLNLLMIHPFFKKYALSFNGLSWYLAITMFLYIIAFPLIKLIKKQCHPYTIVALVLIIISGFNIANRIGMELYLYTNPAYRVLDFTLGMLIAKIYIEGRIEIKNYNTLEGALVVLFLIQYCISLIIETDPGYYSILFSIALYVFAVGQGFISKILSSKIFDQIAYYSFEFYMFHELALRIFRKVFSDESMFYPLRCVIIAIPALIVSIMAAVLFKKYCNYKYLLKI